MFGAGTLVDERIHISRIQRADETIFLWLQVTGGQILLPILVLTIVLSRHVHRNPVFINFCCSWIVSSVVYSLLWVPTRFNSSSGDDLELSSVYRGRSDPKDLSLNPSPQECLIQASLINGVLPLTACTTLGIVVQLLSNLYYLKKGNLEDGFKKRHMFTLSLLVFPYLVFLLFTLVSVVVGSPIAVDANRIPIPNSNLAIPGVFYCVIVLDNLTGSRMFSLARAPVFLSLAFCALSLLFEGTFIASLCQRNHS
ncbi:hypothetical protein SCHPADRAFT_605159 [Schizopora paradoxa]|uniref:Fungal pheromone STE3G-protein-coupled receptor n=1 Tax=Schizopora paradoxa TaxID=27342 RepID=A0A0H2R9N1_9AGAM|nr:hypothetical protein SCHPADRAFT_605159 [Schizopora paradoxa]